jgi:hypothetical protein
VVEMKKYEELTKADKEKLLIYMTIANGEWIQSIILDVISYVAIFFSLPLMFLGSYRYFLVGIFILAIGATITILNAYYVVKRKKQFSLIFGIDNLYKDVFDIQDSDVRSMKRRVIWEKR